MPKQAHDVPEQPAATGAQSLMRYLRFAREAWGLRDSLFIFEVGLQRHNWRVAWLRSDPADYARRVDDLVGWASNPDSLDWDAVERGSA
jgi:hypothetical protein